MCLPASEDCGSSKAMFMIGVMYESGEGVKQDIDQAIHYYNMSYDAGSVFGKYAIARIYYWGDGVEKDTQKSDQYLKELAEEGETRAEWHLERRMHEQLEELKIDV